MAINRQFFFEQVRATLFTGRLSQKQVEGTTGILDAWESAHANKDDRWLAYALGTAFHETAFTMQPIHEFGGNAYFFRMYDKGSPIPARRAVAARLGNTQAGDGILFHGRGFVQLTGRSNYTSMGSTFAVDLTSSAAAADRVLNAQLAGKIMFLPRHPLRRLDRRLPRYRTGSQSMDIATPRQSGARRQPYRQESVPTV